MKTNHSTPNLKHVLIFFIFFNLISLGNSQDKYFQVQIGGQLMQNYNLDGVITKGIGLGGGYVESKQSIVTTFNQDISLTYSFNRQDAVILGGGLYTTCRRIDAIAYNDTQGSNNFYDVKACYENYVVYLLYQYTEWMSPKWNIHASIGPMWAKNHNQGDWFFVPVKFNYFSGIGKLGVQSKLSDHLSLELNVMAIRSLTNIVDESQGAIGSIVPFLVGLDFRVGYQF